MKRWICLLMLAAVLVAATAASAAQPAPGFTLPTILGGSLSLTSLKGKVVVLNFFRGQCPYCVQEVPDLNGINQQLGPRGVAVVGMGLGSTDSLKSFAGYYKVAYPVVVVSEGVRQAYSDVPGTMGLRGVPTTVIVGPDGQVAKAFVGRVPKGDLEAAIQPLLPKK